MRTRRVIAWRYAVHRETEVVRSFGPFVGAACLLGAIGAGRAGAQVKHNPGPSFIGVQFTERAGSAVAGIGDVNGDGFDDVVVGGPFAQGSGKVGMVRIYSGVQGAVLYTVLGDEENDTFGFCVAGVGDVNGDGAGDIVAGAPRANLAGRAKILSGADGAVLRTFNGGSSGDLFGSSVAGAGDVNGDGTPDVIVGCSFGGYARVFSGLDGSLLREFSRGVGELFGKSVAGAGDLNGDGFAEVLVGDPREPDGDGVRVGRVHVYSGADGTELYTFTGDQSLEQFGDAVAGAGDTNADGVPDIVVGIFGDGDAGPSAGHVILFSGADGSMLHEFFGAFLGDRFGRAVGGAGDLDGDGHDDIIVGARLTNSNNIGSVSLLSGRDGSTLGTFIGDAGEDELGAAVAGAGDTNGDGYADVIVGAPLNDTNAIQSGLARLYCSVPPGANPCPADFNGDESVDTRDVIAFLSAWTAGCP